MYLENICNDICKYIGLLAADERVVAGVKWGPERGRVGGGDNAESWSRDVELE